MDKNRFGYAPPAWLPVQDMEVLEHCRSIKREEPRRADRVRQPDAMPRQAAARSGGREEPDSFEEKLKHFMADSNSRISGVRQYEHRTRNRKR